MGITLTDVLLFGKAQLADVDKATLVIYRRNILRWSALGGYLDVIVKGVAPLSLPDAIADSLSYVKAFGGTEQRNLPDNYIERQFIYMMGGSYLLTDIIPTGDMRIELDFQTTSMPSGSVYLLGGRTDSNGGILFAQGIGGVCIVDAIGRYTSNVSFSNNTRYKFTFDNKVVTLESGGTALFTNTFTGEMVNGAALVINGLNSNGTVSGGQAGIYLYSFKAWDNQGNLIADYVPAVQKGTVPVVGFYDTVSKTFKTATAGTFAAGGEAVPTPDAPMDIVSNNGVLRVSKNLFDFNTITSSTISIPVENGKTYTWSFDRANYGFRWDSEKLWGVNSGGNVVTGGVTFISPGDYMGVDHYTFTVVDPRVVAVQTIFRGSSMPASVANIKASKMMFQIGTQRTTYHPYGEIYADSKSKNLFNDATKLDDVVLTDGGEETSIALGSVSDYIKIKPNTTYTLSFIRTQSEIYTRVCTYSADKTFIDLKVKNTDTSAGAKTYTFTTDSNAEYIRFCFKTDSTNVQLEQGSTATAYEPYWDTTETIWAHGKNLFDKNDIKTGGYFRSSTGEWVSANGFNSSGFIPVTAGQKYVKQGEIFSGLNSCVFYDANKNYISTPNAYFGNNQTVTVPSGAAYMRVLVRDNFLDILQVERGSTATAYAPYYDGGTATAEMLLKVGDYQDQQEIIDGVVTRRVGVYVLDGTETCVMSSGMFRANVSLPVEKQPGWQTRRLCTHGICTSASTRNRNIEVDGNAIWFGGGIVSDMGWTTSDDGKQWLAEQYAAGTPVIVIYPLATPTTESVAGQTLQVQQGDNIVEITQASLNSLELEAEYQAAVALTIQEVQDANLDPNVEVTIN